MPKFKVTYEREVTEFDRVVREIEANTLEEAKAIAAEEATSFNSDCPDDTEQLSGEFGDWYLDQIEEIKERSK